MTSFVMRRRRAACPMRASLDIVAAVSMTGSSLRNRGRPTKGSKSKARNPALAVLTGPDLPTLQSLVFSAKDIVPCGIWGETTCRHPPYPQQRAQQDGQRKKKKKAAMDAVSPGQSGTPRPPSPAHASSSASLNGPILILPTSLEEQQARVELGPGGQAD